MKKLFLPLIIILLTAALAACGNTAKTSDNFSITIDTDAAIYAMEISADGFSQGLINSENSAFAKGVVFHVALPAEQQKEYKLVIYGKDQSILYSDNFQLPDTETSGLTIGGTENDLDVSETEFVAP